MQNRSKIQWSDRLKIILHLIKEKVGTERGWMKRLYNEWNNQLPMYNMFSKQNLRDQWTRQNITVPEGINLNHLIDQERFEYKEKQKTRTGTIADVVIEGANTDDNEEIDFAIIEGNDSETEESFIGFSEENIKQSEDELELWNEYKFWKSIDMGERKRLKEISKNCQVKYWNERIPNILQKQDHWTLWEIDSLMYAAITKILKKIEQNASKRMIKE